VADERAAVLYDWMAGYGAEQTPERPTDDACEDASWPTSVAQKLSELPQKGVEVPGTRTL